MLDQNDSTLIGGELRGGEVLGNKTLYSFTNDVVTVNDFYSKLKSDTEFTGKKFNNDFISRAIKKYSDQQVLEEKANTLDKTDSEFAELMKDYQNGIFIFKLQEDEVWNKVKIDSVKLFDFYQKNMEKYKWDNRVAFTEIFARRDSVIRHYYDLLKSGENFDSLASKTERPNMKEKHGKYELQIISSDLSKIADGLSKIGDYSEPIPNQGGFSIIRLDERDPARLKTFEEAKAEVSGAFQEFESRRLENEYIDSLKKRYSPVINYDQLRKAFTQYTK